jgi:hypothetical protein
VEFLKKKKRKQKLSKGCITMETHMQAILIEIVDSPSFKKTIEALVRDCMEKMTPEQRERLHRQVQEVM